MTAVDSVDSVDNVDSVDSVYSVQRDCSFGPDKQNAAAARAQRQWGPQLHT